MFIQFQLVTIVSAPSLRKRKSGMRLTKKAVFTAVFTWERAQDEGFGLGVKVENSG